MHGLPSAANASSSNEGGHLIGIPISQCVSEAADFLKLIEEVLRGSNVGQFYLRGSDE
jgi:hypothetical protein